MQLRAGKRQQAEARRETLQPDMAPLSHYDRTIATTPGRPDIAPPGGQGTQAEESSESCQTLLAGSGVSFSSPGDVAATKTDRRTKTLGRRASDRH